MAQTKSLTLTVRESFDLPAGLLKASPEQLGTALLLADALLDAGTHFHHNSDMKQLREKIKQLESTTVESVREEAIRIARAELRAEATSNTKLLTELSERISDLKKEKQSLYDKLSIKEDEHKQERIQLSTKLEELQEKLQQRIAIQSNSSKRGLEGEKDFQRLTSHVKDWTLESVGKTKESADFRASIHSMEVRFEVKNHETEVPYTKNVDKFERDMKAHPSTKVGVFVALTARIEKLDDAIQIRWTDDKQLLIFLPYFLSRDLAYTYDMIENLIRTMKYLRPFFETKDTSKDVELLTDKIETTIHQIQLMDKQVSTMLKDHQDYTVKTTANYQALKSFILSLLSDLTGKDQELPKKKRQAKKKPQETTSD